MAQRPPALLHPSLVADELLIPPFAVDRIGSRRAAEHLPLALAIYERALALPSLRLYRRREPAACSWTFALPWRAYDHLVRLCIAAAEQAAAGQTPSSSSSASAPSMSSSSPSSSTVAGAATSSSSSMLPSVTSAPWPTADGAAADDPLGVAIELHRDGYAAGVLGTGQAGVVTTHALLDALCRAGRTAEAGALAQELLTLHQRRAVKFARRDERHALYALAIGILSAEQRADAAALRLLDAAVDAERTLATSDNNNSNSNNNRSVTSAVSALYASVLAQVLLRADTRADAIVEDTAQRIAHDRSLLSIDEIGTRLIHRLERGLPAQALPPWPPGRIAARIEALSRQLAFGAPVWSMLMSAYAHANDAGGVLSVMSRLRGTFATAVIVIVAVVVLQRSRHARHHHHPRHASPPTSPSSACTSVLAR